MSATSDASHISARDSAPGAPARPLPRRILLPALLFALVCSLAGQVVALALWGFAETRMLSVTEVTAELPDLPQHWQGRRIAVFGDPQIGLCMDNRGVTRRAAQRAVAAQPAAILLLGDYVYLMKKPGGPELDALRWALQPLADSDVPCFAVLGNHDLGLQWPSDATEAHEAASVRTLLRELGVQLLHNRAEPLTADAGAPLYVIGLGPASNDDDRPLEALAGVPPRAPRIFFMHNPDSFSRIPAGEAPLAVAGHTHGGQLRIPLTEDWSWVAWYREHYPPMDAWSEDHYGVTDNRLYVNRGIGMSTMPIRLNCTPELTLLTLQSQGDA